MGMGAGHAAAAAAAAPAGGVRRARGLGEDELVMQSRRTTWGKIVEFVIGPL
jgi:peptidyl-tRNA hydrolase